MKLISTKFNGVYYNQLKTDDRVFYIKYYIDGVQIQEKVGSLHSGVTAQYSANLRNERLLNPTLISKDILFKDVVHQYMKHITNKSSFNSTRIRINKHIIPYFKRMKLSDIKPNHIMNFKAMLEASKPPYAMQTIKHYIIIIRQVYNYAIKMDIYNSSNPASSSKIDIPKVDNSRNMYMNNLEVENYISYCKSGNLAEHYSSLFLFALYTGMRKSEMLNLTWKEINFENNNLRLINTKSKKNHILILPDVAIKILIELHKSKRSDYVFTYPDGKKIMDIKNVWQRFRNTIGLRSDIRFHDIRHTFGTQAVTAGIPLDVVQRMMTHASIQTTQRYAHIVDKRMIDASIVMNNLYK